MSTDQWTVTDTLLYFVGIPAAVVVVIAALALATGGGRRPPRYRPGRPFEFTPVWFLSAPENLAESAAPALPAGGRLPALSGAGEDITRTPVRAGELGGASDRW